MITTPKKSRPAINQTVSYSFLVQTGLNGNIIKANDVFAQAIGISQNQLEDLSLLSFFGKNYFFSSAADLVNILQHSSSFEFETTIRPPKKPELLTKWIVSKISTENNAVQILEWIGELMPDNKTLPAGFQEGDMYRTIFAHSPQPMWIIETETLHLLDANDAACKYYGYPKEEFLKLSVTDLWPEPGTKELVDYFSKGNDLHSNERSAIVHQRRDGILVTVEITHAHFTYQGQNATLVIINDISEKKEIEKIIQETESRFRNMADTAPVMIWMTDENDKTIYVNKYWSDFTGVRVSEAMGDGWTKVVYPKDKHIGVDEYKAGFDKRQPVSLVYRLKFRTGEYRWVLDNAVPRFLDDGTFLGYVGSVVDINDRKIAEEKVKLQADLIEKVSDAIISTDINFKITTWNNAAENIYCIKAADAIGKSVDNLLKYEYVGITSQEAMAVLLEKGSWQGEVVYLCHSTKRVHLMCSVKKLTNEKQEAIGFIAVNRNVTDKVLAEEKIKKSESFYRSLIGDSLDGIALTDIKGEVTFVAPSVTNILQFQPEELIGKNVFDMVHPDDVDYAREQFISEVQYDPKEQYIQVRVQKKNGEWLWCSVRGHNLLHNEYVRSIVVYFNDDSRRKSIEDELKESEKRFRLLSENSKDVVCLHHIDGSYLYVSPSAYRLLGYKPDELVGRNPYEFFHPADISGKNAFTAIRNLKKFITSPFQYRFRKKDGNYVCLETTTQPIYGPGNKIISLQTTSRDITDRMEVLQELKKKEQAFRNLAENAPTIIQRLDKEFRYVYCNKTYTNVFGRPVADIIGKKAGDLLPPGTDKDRFLHAAAKVFREKVIETLKVHLRRHDNTEWDFLVTIAPEINESGEAETILAISSNITELSHKEALLISKEEELIQSHQRFEMAVKATSDAIFESNVVTGYTFISQEFTERFGYTQEDIKNKDLQWIIERIHTEDRLSVISKITQTFAKKENFWHDEFRWRSKDGSFKYILNRAYLFYDEEGKPYKAVGSVQDIGERKNAESLLIQKDILLSAAAQAANELLTADLESGINKSLNIIGVAAKADRSYIFQYFENNTGQGNYYRQLYEWNSGKNEPQIDNPELQDFKEEHYPEIFGQIKEGFPNELLIKNATRAPLRKHMQGQEIRSLLVVPIFVGKKFWGFVGFDQCSYERSWTSVELDTLKLYASGLAAAIERKSVEQSLEESKIKFKSLFQNSLDIVHVLDAEGVIKYVTPSVSTVLGYDEKEVNEQNWFSFIHPEDLKRSRKIFEDLILNKDISAITDIRVKNNAGKWIWVEAKGINKLHDPIIKGLIVSFRDISDRKQSEQQLQGYSEHITNILNSITDGFIALDNNFNVLWWNPIAAKLTGIKDVEVLGKNLWEAVPLLRNTIALQECSYAVKEKMVVNFELYVDELKTYFDINAYPSLQGLFVYFKDITGKKSQEMLLSLEKEVLELNASPSATLETTVDYFLKGIEQLNPGLIASVLLLEENGRYMQHLSAPSLPKSYTDAINGLEIGPEVGSCGTAMYLHRAIIVDDIQNSPLWKPYLPIVAQHDLAACWSFPIVTSNNSVLGSFAAYYKTVKSPTEFQVELFERAATLLGVIIENKQSAQKINISNERYLLATKATNDAIWDYDIKNNHLYWGESFFSLFGYKSTQQTNRHGFWESKIHADDRSRVINTYDAAIANKVKDIVYSEYRFQKADNSYAIIADRAFIVYDQLGNPTRFVGSMQDITERKKMEKKLIKNEINKEKLIAQAVIDAQEKERAEIGKELHDNVNQILSTAKLYLELAKTDVKQKDELIKRSADNIFNAINEIRNISKALVPPSVKDLGLIDSVKDLVESLRMTGALQVKFLYKGDLEKIISDKQKLMLFRIIQEQVNNVLKHAEASELSIEIKIHEKSITLSITDNGKGFRLENVKFKKGVGLSNIESRAHLFNGKVTISSSPGNGCKLFIQVPIQNN